MYKEIYDKGEEKVILINSAETTVHPDGKI